MPTRRWMLQATGAALAISASRRMWAQAASPAGRSIDVHNHIAAPAFNDFNRRFAGATAPLPWNADAMLRDMDETGTALALLSGFTPSVGGTAADRARLSRETNEFGAKLAQDHRGRLALFATLPLPDIDASLREATHALDVLGAAGLTVYTDAGQHYLGSETFFDLYSELDRRQAVVFVHPHAPECCTNLVPKVPDTMIEFGAATSRTIAGLIFGGATQRFPRIKWIFSHGGGTVPYLIERFLGGTVMELAPGVVVNGGSVRLQQPPGTALAELRKLYYDTAQIANPVALQALKTVMGPSQILYGTDAWFRTQKETTQGVVKSGVFSDAELAMVMRDNALRVMPGLSRLLPA